MKPDLEKHMIVDKNKKYNIIDIDKYKVTDIFDLKNGREIITYTEVKDELHNKLNFGRLPNVFVTITAFVTAYARLHRSQFRNKMILILLLI
jgi:hypothetical protein